MTENLPLFLDHLDALAGPVEGRSKLKRLPAVLEHSITFLGNLAGPEFFKRYGERLREHFNAVYNDLDPGDDEIPAKYYTILEALQDDALVFERAASPDGQVITGRAAVAKQMLLTLREAATRLREG